MLQVGRLRQQLWELSCSSVCFSLFILLPDGNSLNIFEDALGFHFQSIYANSVQSSYLKPDHATCWRLLYSVAVQNHTLVLFIMMDAVVLLLKLNISLAGCLACFSLLKKNGFCWAFMSSCLVLLVQAKCWTVWLTGTSHSPPPPLSPHVLWGVEGCRSQSPIPWFWRDWGWDQCLYTTVLDDIPNACR